MKKLLQLGLLLALAAPVCYGQIQGLGQSKITSSGPCLDKDGDGYGVGAGCLGPDADDDDPTVNTAATVLAKYGPDPGPGNANRPINSFLTHLGYTDATGTWVQYQTLVISGSSITSKQRVWCIDATNGNDSTGAVSTISADDACTPGGSYGSPFATFNASEVLNNLEAGDIVIVRAGSYSNSTDDVVPIPSKGTAGNPIIFVAYPGEQPIIAAGTGDGFDGDTNSSSNYVIDGFKVTGDPTSGSSLGIDMGAFVSGQEALVSNIGILHNDVCCVSGGVSGNIAGDNLHNVVVEENVSHDVNAGGGGHNIYLGSNTQASDGVIIARNITYNQMAGEGPGNSVPQIQFNGRCNNSGTLIPCQITQNLVYSGNASGISVTNGFAHSFITSNVMFNTGGGIRIFDYNGNCNMTNAMTGGVGPNNETGTICPYDTNYNVVANNTTWTNPTDPDGENPPDGSSGFYLARVTANNTTEEIDPIASPGMSWSSGTVTANYTVANSTQSAGETAIAVGQTITVSGVSPSGYNGTFTVASVTVNPSSFTQTLTYTLASNPGAYSSGGQIVDAYAFCPNGEAAPCGDVGHNTYVNNITIGAGQGGNPPVMYSPQEAIGAGINSGLAYLQTDTFTNELIWGLDGSSEVVSTGGLVSGTDYTCSAIPAASNTGCINANPDFVQARATDYAAPQNFSLYPESGSPALDAGTTTDAPALDAFGKPYWNHAAASPCSAEYPSLGAIERLGYPCGWTDIAGSALEAAAPTGSSGSIYGWTACPTPGQGGSVDQNGDPYNFQYYCAGVMHGWSGGLADGAHSYLWFFGGGHSDYFANELYRVRVDLQPGLLERVTRPSITTAAMLNGTSPYDSPYGDPWQIDSAQTNAVLSTQCISCATIGGHAAKANGHFYGQLTYIPASAFSGGSYSQGALFTFAGGEPNIGAHFDDTWLFDPSSLSGAVIQEHMQNPASGKDPYVEPPSAATDQPLEGVSAYDAATGLVWVMFNNGLYEYNPSSNSYTIACGQASCTPNPSLWNAPYGGYGAIDPLTHQMFVLGSMNANDGGHIMCTDLSGGSSCGTVSTAYQAVDLISSAPSCAIIAQNAGPENSSSNSPPRTSGAGSMVSFNGMTWDSSMNKFVLWTPYPGWPAQLYVLSGYEILDSNGHLQKVTTAGTTGGSQPAWNSSGGTTADGSAVWTDQGVAPTPPVWTFDPSAMTCASYALPGGPTRTSPGDVGTFGRMSYVPTAKVTVVAADYNVDAYTLCMNADGCGLSYPADPPSAQNFDPGAFDSTVFDTGANRYVISEYEGGSVSDSVSRGYRAVRSAADSAAVSEHAASLFGSPRPGFDGMVFSSSVFSTGGNSYIVLTADFVSVAEAAPAYRTGKGVLVSELLSLTDSSERRAALHASPSEVVAESESGRRHGIHFAMTSELSAWSDFGQGGSAGRRFAIGAVDMLSGADSAISRYLQSAPPVKFPGSAAPQNYGGQVPPENNSGAAQ